MVKIETRHLSRREVLEIFASLFVAGCGGGGGGGSSPNPSGNTAPIVTLNWLDNYEGEVQGFNLYSQDPDGTSSASFKYYAPFEKIIVLQRVVEGIYYGETIPLPSGRYPYQASATDTKGLASIVNGEFVRYATAENARSMMLSTLTNYAAVGTIADLKVPSQIDAPDPDDPLTNLIIVADTKFRHLPSGRYVVGWYVGKGDGDYTVQKAALDSISVPWFQINPCPASEIPAKVSGFINSGCISGSLL